MGSLPRRAARGLGRLLTPLLGLALRLLFRSWRLRVLDPSAVLAGLSERPKPVVIALWHADLVPCGAVLHRRLVERRHGISALVSRSADGDVLAKTARGFGFHAIRGSTSRGGLAALRALYREIERGLSVVIAPDGPRGPARVAQPGIVQVALLAGVPLVPMAAAARPAWRAGSWDRTLIPKPWAEVVVAVGGAMRFERGADSRAGAERLAAALEDLSRAATAAVQGAEGSSK